MTTSKSESDNTKKIEEKFWTALKSDMTVMLGLLGADEGHMVPMTAQLDGDKGPIWFFTSQQTELARSLKTPRKSVATFVAKNQSVYATLHGSLRIDNDRKMIDKLWSPFVAAWFEGGKEDPNLLLLRLDATEAQVWLDGSSLMAGIRMLLGIDPKETYKDNVAELKLVRK